MLVQAAAREVSDDVNFASSCLLGSPSYVCSHMAFVSALPWLSVSPDVVLHLFASRTKVSCTTRGKVGQIAGAPRQKDRSEAKQALLSDFSHYGSRRTLRKKARQKAQLFFHNIVLSVSVFDGVCAVLVVFFP